MFECIILNLKANGRKYLWSYILYTMFQLLLFLGKYKKQKKKIHKETSKWVKKFIANTCCRSHRKTIVPFTEVDRTLSLKKWRIAHACLFHWQDINISACTSGRGQMILSDHDGALYFLDRQMELKMFRAYEIRVSHLHQMKQHNILVTVGVSYFKFIILTAGLCKGLFTVDVEFSVSVTAM